MGNMGSSFRGALGRLLPLSQRSRSFLLFTFFVQAGLGVQTVAYNLWLLALGYPAAWLGRLMAVGAAAGLAGSLPLAWLGRRWGARPLLLLAGALGGLPGAASLLWPRPALLLPAAAGSGLAAAALAVVANPLMASLEPPGRASLLFSSQFAVGQLASLLGSLLGGGLPAWMEAWGRVAALRDTLGVSLLLTAFALFPLLALDGAGGGAAPVAAAGPAGPGRPPRSARRRRSARGLLAPALLVLAEAVTGAGAGLVIPYLNVFLVRRYGASTGQVGTLFALGSVATAALALAAGRAARRLGPARVGMALELLSLPLLLAVPHAPSLPVAGAELILRTGLMNAAEPLRGQFAMEAVAPPARNWLAALQNLAWEAAWAAATAWAGPRVDAGAFPLLFRGTALAYALGVALWLVVALRLSAGRRQAGPAPGAGAEGSAGGK